MRTLCLLVLLIFAASRISLAFLLQPSRSFHGFITIGKAHLSSSLLNTRNEDLSRSFSSLTSHNFMTKRRSHSSPLTLRNSILSLQDTDIDRQSLYKTCFIMFVISAPLGTLLDNYHGLFDVLNYNSNALPYQIYNPFVPDQLMVKSAAFVGPLFGLAGFIMSLLQILLDAKFSTPMEKRMPSWPFTFNSIGFFALQYYLSGLLDYTGWSNLFINIFLFVYSMIGWRLYDSSKAGFILGILTGFPLSLLYLLNSIRNSQSYLQLSTPFGLHVALVAISGPLAELALINIPHFYIYTHQDFYGICSWIPWVYFFGAAAVGNLSRSVYNFLHSNAVLSKDK